jgi:hypothetical protein
VPLFTFGPWSEQVNGDILVEKRISDEKDSHSPICRFVFLEKIEWKSKEKKSGKSDEPGC